MNLGEMIKTNQDILEEPTFTRFSREEHVRWLNRALEDIALRTGYIQSQATTTLSSGVSEMLYPRDAIRILSIDYNDAPLEKTTMEWLDQNIENWRKESGPPSKWFEWRNFTYGIYPVPDTDYIVRVHYIATDDELVNDVDTPNLPAPFHIALCYFACREMAGEDEQLEKASYCGGKYKELVSELYRMNIKARKFKAPNVIKLEGWE